MDSKDFWMFDCSDLHGRKVAHASRGLPENSGLQPQKGMYVVEVAPGLDVALVRRTATRRAQGREQRLLTPP